MTPERSEKLIPNPGIICIIGPEGSGKSLLAETLSHSLHIPRVSTGGMLREIDNNVYHPLYEVVHQMFCRHVYLDAATLLAVVGDRFKQPDIEKGCVLDGGFRTVEEAQGFPDTLLSIGRNLPVTIIQLKLPGWIGAGRILSTDRNRTDDTQEAIISRLSEFYTDYQTRLQVIKSHMYPIIEVDAKQTPEAVFDKVIHELSVLRSVDTS